MLLELRLIPALFLWLTNLIDSSYWHSPKRTKGYDPHKYYILNIIFYIIFKNILKMIYIVPLTSLDIDITFQLVLFYVLL